MRFIWLLSFLLFFLPQVSFAEVKRLAVLEFVGVNLPDNSMLALLSDGVRGGLIKKIDTKQYLVMTRESTLQILKDNGKDASCIAGECEVEIGRNIGADFVISGSVTYFANNYIVTLKLHNTATSALLSSNQLKDQDPMNLIDQMPSLGERLMVEGKLISGTDSSSSSSISGSTLNSSGIDFGGGISGDLQQKLKEKKCREEAESQGRPQRESRLSQEVVRLQNAAKEAWNKMQSDFQTCLELDVSDRTPCVDGLEGWYRHASTLEVVLNEGSESVKTSCGLRDEVFGRLSQKVSVPELSLAEEMREQLKRTSKGGKSLSGKGYEAVLIPSGGFSMGCTTGDSDCDSGEKPVHKVTISKSFYMMKTEVTQGLYESVMGSNPSYFSSCGKDCPVEQVSWYDAVRFANKLSEQEGLAPCYQIGGGNEPSVSWTNKSCNGWRLPTEAEWEYASRGGESYKYAGSNNIDEVAWYDGNSGSKTHPVGQKKANGYGLYDMSGNVWQWVWDSAVLDSIYNFTGASSKYSSWAQTDPSIDTSSPNRVIRGGSWDRDGGSTRVSNRSRYYASSRSSNLGFRILRTIP